MKPARKKILVVDDEEALRTILTSELNSVGYDAYSLDLKHNACDWVVQNQPDIILSDIKAPVMDGFQFLTWLKANPFTRNVKFVFVTGFADLKNAVESKKLGADDFISKPYDLVDLLETIERVLGEGGVVPVYPKKKTLEEAAVAGELRFVEWHLLREQFLKLLQMASERTAVIKEFHWTIRAVIDHRHEPIGLEFTKPLTFNSISFDDIIELRAWLASNGLKRGIAMGYFSVPPRLQVLAGLLGIQFIDGRMTDTLLRFAIESDKLSEKRSLLDLMQIDLATHAEQLLYQQFLEKLGEEIQQLKGKPFSYPQPVPGKEVGWKQTEVSIVEMDHFYLRFREEAEQHQHWISMQAILQVCFDLWVQGAIKTVQIKLPLNEQSLMLKLLSQLPSLECSDDWIVLNISELKDRTDHWRLPPLIAWLDDDNTTLEHLSQELKDEGFRVMTNQDKDEFLRQLPDLRPDLIVTDIESPRFGGLDFIRAAKSDPRFRKIPIIVVSGQSEKKHVVERAEKYGVVALFPKPFEMADLVATIRRTLK
jgi:CheY-like chemotaxis protein